MFAIEKSVDITGSHPGGRPAKYPFGLMEIGDSFFVPDRLIGRKAVFASATWSSRHPGWRFVSRQEGEGIRIWRIA